MQLQMLRDRRLLGDRQAAQTWIQCVTDNRSGAHVEQSPTREAELWIKYNYLLIIRITGNSLTSLLPFGAHSLTE